MPWLAVVAVAATIVQIEAKAPYCLLEDFAESLELLRLLDEGGSTLATEAFFCLCLPLSDGWDEASAQESLFSFVASSDLAKVEDLVRVDRGAG
jgi:hypothetical protein